MQTIDNINNQNHQKVSGVAEGNWGEVFRLEKSGQYVMDFPISCGFSGDPIRIAFVTDAHINLCDAIDEKSDPEVMNTKLHRFWNADGAAIAAIDRVMPLTEGFDAVILGGDILDYQTHGAMQAAKDHLFSRYPHLLAAVGGHDVVKEMQTGLPEQRPLADRIAFLRSFWPNDIDYATRLVRDKLLLAVLGNAREAHEDGQNYTEKQVERLQDDILRAREQGQKILIFQHEPLSTGHPEDRDCKAIWVHDAVTRNFYDGNYCGSPERTGKDDCAMYRLITENADVIAGVITGHLHSAFATGIAAKKNGIPTEIPQFCAAGNPYMQYAGILTQIRIL